MIQKIINLWNRSSWLAQLMPCRLAAVLFLIQARTNRLARSEGTYKTHSFVFRGCDLSALKEVLIDQEYAFLTSLVKSKKPPVIVDVGAHIGTFALWALSENPSARILSVEADPKTYALLLHSSTLSSNADTPWTCTHRAAWKNNDNIAFSDEGDSMSHKVLKTGSLQVSGITLPELIEQTGEEKIDLMKVDIEGAEEAFICEYPESLKNIHALVIELHPQLCDTEKVRDTLGTYFKTITEIEGRISSKPLLYCTK